MATKRVAKIAATKRPEKTTPDKLTSNDPMNITNKDFERLYAGQPITHKGQKSSKNTPPVRAAANVMAGNVARAAFAEHGRRIDARNRTGARKTGEKKTVSTGRRGKK